jgi:hypothetical protein
MNRKTALIFALQAFLIIVLAWMLVFYGKDEYEAFIQGGEEEEIETPSHVVTEAGSTIVTLNSATQAQSDIQTSPLKAATHQHGFYSYGSVISIEPLLSMRTQYLAAKAEADVARASLANSRREHERLQQLNQDDRNISDRAVMAAEALRKADEARVAAAEIAANSIRVNIGQTWGETLAAELIAQQPSESLRRLLQHQDALLQVTLPFDYTEPKPGSTLAVSPAGARGKSIPARFVSASPQADPALQGKTYFYRAPANELRTGMRVMIRMPSQDGKPTQGVIVPDNAVIWYGGQAWIYRKEGEDRFIRHAITTDNEIEGGWFNAGSLKPGELVVTQGAQLLLSEEFKYQITNENED